MLLRLVQAVSCVPSRLLQQPILMIKYEIYSLSMLNHGRWPRRMGVSSKPDLGCLLPPDVLSKGQYPRYCWRGACGTLLPLCHAAASSMHRHFLRTIAAGSRRVRCEETVMICWLETEVQDEFERPLKAHVGVAAKLPESRRWGATDAWDCS